MGVFSLRPQLFVEAPKAAEAVEFYKAAFGAQELGRATYPKQKAANEDPLTFLCVQLKLADSIILVCDQTDETVKLPDGAAGFSFCLETEDVERAFADAVKAGAVVVKDISDEYGGCCGARSGKVKDPFGYVWVICIAGKSCAVSAA